MKLTKEDKKKIAELRLFHNLPEKWIAKKFGIHRTNVTYYTKLVDRYGFDIFDQLPKYTKYTNEFKERVVKQFLANRTATVEIALEHKLPNPSLIYQWLKNYNSNCGKIVTMNKGRKTKTNSTQSNSVDVSALIKEIEYLKAENDYLKKLKALREEKERLQIEKKQK